MFIIKSALNTLVNQIKCSGGYNECLDCKATVKLEVNDNDNVNQGTCFADVNDNVNVNVSDNDHQGACFEFTFNFTVKGKLEVNDNDNVNQGTCFADVNDNVNVNVKDNDSQGTCFADDKLIGNDKGNGKQEFSLSEEDDTVWSRTHERGEVLDWYKALLHQQGSPFPNQTKR